MGAPASSRRIINELADMARNPVEGIRLNQECTQDSLDTVFIDVDGAPGSLYDGEKFQLKFQFNDSYPFDSPAVIFTGNHVPIHPHIYSNGHICLSILTTDWSPALSIQSVCLSIVSMLSSCKNKVPPRDNAFYSMRAKDRNPKLTYWLYDDDTV